MSYVFVTCDTCRERKRNINCTFFKREHAVAQLVEALRYKPEGRGFDSRWCHYNFSLT